MDLIIDLIGHRIGVFVLDLMNDGRFKVESGLAWGCRRRTDSVISIRSILGLNLQVRISPVMQLIKSQRRRLTVLFPSPGSHTFGLHKCSTEVRLIKETTF